MLSSVPLGAASFWLIILLCGSFSSGQVPGSNPAIYFFQFQESDYNVAENSPILSVCLVFARGPPSVDQTISITVTTQDGTAEAISDFAVFRVTLTFPTGSPLGTRQCLDSIVVFDDNLTEGTENFIVVASATDQRVGFITGRNRATVNIIDDDRSTEIYDFQFTQTTYDVPEAPQARSLACIRLVDAQPSSLQQDVTINVLSTTSVSSTAIADVDYVRVASTLTITAGDTPGREVCVSLVTVDDNSVEGNEHFELIARSLMDSVRFTPGRNTTIVNIIDDDTVVALFERLPGQNVANYTIPEDVGSIEVCIILSENQVQLATTVTVLFETSDGQPGATGPADYRPVDSRPITFTPQPQSRRICVSVDINDDDITEGDEVFNILLTSNDESVLLDPVASTGTVWIIDNDVVVIRASSASYTVEEADGVLARVELVLTGQYAPGQECIVSVITADNTSTGGMDYVTVSQTLTFTDTVKELSVSIAILDDNEYEQEEQFYLGVATSSKRCQIQRTSQQISILVTDNEIVCPMEVDEAYGLSWQPTQVGVTVRQLCGFLRDRNGTATRLCGAGGIWEPPDVWQCEDRRFIRVRQQSNNLFRDDALSIQKIPDALGLIENLAVLTRQPLNGRQSLFPRDLVTASSVVVRVIDLLSFNVDFTRGDEFGETLEIVNIINNIVETNNNQGIRDVQQHSIVFSQEVLNSAERYGLYLANAVAFQGSIEEQVISTNNIVLKAANVNTSTIQNDLEFSPCLDDRQSSILRPASIRIPSTLLQQRAKQDGTVLVANLLIQNLEPHLSSSLNVIDNPTAVQPVSAIMSSQVGLRNATVPIRSTEEEPIALQFRVNSAQTEDLVCAFWNFSNPIGRGGWSSDNVTTGRVSIVGDGTAIVECSTTHLTSFAVLVNLAGAQEVVSNKPLTIASYIGIAISLLFLLVTIIFFLSFGKKLFSSVHNFVHLNLAIALFLGYLLFVVGIDNATRNEVACKVVAAMLHYLFLSVFCWMLCEGVMLYLLIWVVFSRLSKKWWFFLLLGWGPPLVLVLTSLASVVEKYGVKDQDGNLRFCWLSSGTGAQAIWTFVVPMLIIISINTFFLVLVLIAIFRTKKSSKAKVQKEGIRIDLAITIVKASLILLPLLGATWVIGLFAVNRQTLVFAWVFTILTTLQGLFIFITQVLRSEKVRGIFSKYKKSISSHFKTTSSKINKQSRAHRPGMPLNSGTSATPPFSSSTSVERESRFASTNEPTPNFFEFSVPTSVCENMQSTSE